MAAIYLVVHSLTNIEEFLANNKVSVILSKVPTDNELTNLIALAHSKLIPVIIPNDVDKVIKYKADGVHFENIKNGNLEQLITNAKLKLSEAHTVGINTNNSIDVAMAASELDVDYIMFNNDSPQMQQTINNWLTDTNIPVVVFDKQDINNIENNEADFIAIELN
ncbi:MAG: thiamine phosphate synthase [Sphingobacteriia bacterium]|nr:thiamine phosphate synthase [Sphingobacteriia bacterium]